MIRKSNEGSLDFAPDGIRKRNTAVVVGPQACLGVESPRDRALASGSALDANGDFAVVEGAGVGGTSVLNCF